MFWRPRISSGWTDRRMGAGIDAAAARSGAFAAHPQGHGRRDSDSLPSVRKAGAGSIVARAELFRAADERPYVDSVVRSSSGYRTRRSALFGEGIADVAARCATGGRNSARALSLQRHESDGDLAGWIHQAADL